MTSTEFTVGLEGSRNSSKVLKPPGGGSSDIFGCASAAQYSSNERQKNKEAASGNTQNRLFGTPYDTTSNSVKKQTSSVFASEPPAAPRSAKKSYVRRNPITGEEIEIYPKNEKEENGKENEESEKEVQENGEEEKKPEIPTKPIQTSIRVRNPPGGKSSGIF